MRLPSILLLCLASTVVLMRAEATMARPGQDKERGELVQGTPRDPALTAESAAREIQRQHGGKVLAVQADGPGYRVKVLKDGEVRIYQVGP